MTWLVHRGDLPGRGHQRARSRIKRRHDMIGHAAWAYGLPLVRRITPRRRDHSIDLNGLAVPTRRLGGRAQPGN